MILDQILSFLLLYKYFALFLITFFASVTNITPASSSLIASGSFIALGQFDYVQVFTFALLGTVLGDIAAYLLSYYYGKEILIRIGFKKILKSKNFSKAEKLFKKNSTLSIFISRFFITSFGPIINIIAGLSKINYKKFILLSIFGETLYVFILTSIGYIFASNWKYILSLFSYTSNILIALIVFITIMYFHRKKLFSK